MNVRPWQPLFWSREAASLKTIDTILQCILAGLLGGALTVRLFVM